MKSKLTYWLMQFSIFLLRGAGWVAVGVVTGFIVSFFFRPVGRVDTFAFTETMLGVVITGLSIVGAFTIALQWSNLDRRVHEFDVNVLLPCDWTQIWSPLSTPALEDAQRANVAILHQVEQLSLRYAPLL